MGYSKQPEQLQATQTEVLCRAVFNCSPVPMWVHDSETGTLLDINDAGLNALGYTRAQAARLNIRDIFGTGKCSKSLGTSKSPIAARECKRVRRSDGSTMLASPVIHPAPFMGPRAELVFLSAAGAVSKSAGEKRPGLFETLAEASPLSVFHFDTKGRLLYCNTFLAQISGFGLTDLLGFGWRRAVLLDDLAKLRRAWRSAVRVSAPFCVELRLRMAEGSMRWLACQLSPVCAARNAPLGYVGSAVEITEQKQTEDAIRGILEASSYVGENFFQAFAPEVARVLGAKCVSIGLVERVEDPHVKLIGRSSEMVPASYAVRGTPSERLMCCPPKTVIFTDHPSIEFPTDDYLRQSGAQAYLGTALHDRHGKVIGFIQATFSERVPKPRFAKNLIQMFAARAAAEVLRWRLEVERERLIDILEHTTDLVATIDRDHKIRYLNRAGRQMLGTGSTEALANLQSSPAWTPGEMETVFQHALSTAAEKGVWGRETTLPGRDGREIPVSQVIIAHRDAEGRVDFLSTICRDISERVAIQSRLELQDAALTAATSAISIINREGNILWANPAFSEQTGYALAELVGRHICVLRSGRHPPEFYRELWQTIVGGRTWRGEVYSRRKDGVVYLSDLAITPVRSAAGDCSHFILLKESLDERREMERHILRAQRLESIGTLAAGVAHDLNNALSPILLGASVLREGCPEHAAPMLETIESSARRGADMVRQLLTFAKGAEGKRVLLQPRHVLTEMEKLLTNTFPKTISLTVCYPGDLRSIVGEATQLYQLLLNLCVNARDAMPDGGTLTLEASNLYVDPALANQIPGAQAGNYVVFRVCDTGCGIPIELQQRVFEPFFSTKGPENATGLGLATVAGIVRGHGGFIRLHSQPGKGATFEVYIPTSAHADTSDVTEQTAPELNGSGQLVLVVDDDPAVREVTKVVLESHNLRVVLAGDGAEGMLRAVENRHQLRAVICDLHMPHLDGIAFIRALRHLSPKLPVIVVTGHREERHDRELSVLGVAKLLEKPHTSAQLLSALKPLLM